MKPANAVIFFDPSCGLCSGLISTLAWLNKDLLFAPLDGKAGVELRERHRTLPDLEGTVLLAEDFGRESETVWLRSDAVLRILHRSGGLPGLLYVFRFVPRSFRDRAYRFIARHRYRWFGRSAVRPDLPADRWLE